MTVSIVSHGHDHLLHSLLNQIVLLHAGVVAHVVITHNLPPPTQPASTRQDPRRGLPFRVSEIHNLQPAGFGTNHNRAFTYCDTPFFCVMNPDMHLTDRKLWPRLVAAAAEPGAGLAYPLLRNADGSRQDSERAVVTPLSLVRRHAFGHIERTVDWVSAAFWMVPASVWSKLDGFDERYFMYCEDVDFCLRLRLAGYRLISARAHAMHDAARSSRRSRKATAWHLRSLARLWTRPQFWRFLKTRQ